MNEPYLPGVLEPGARSSAEWNWYSCHPPKRGEVALVQFGKALPARARIIRAIAGDRFDLKKNLENRNWSLLINGRLVTDYKGEAYFFGSATPPTLSLYVKERKGVLHPGEVIVLSTLSPGFMDSGTFGILSARDLVARIEK